MKLYSSSYLRQTISSRFEIFKLGLIIRGHPKWFEVSQLVPNGRLVIQENLTLLLSASSVDDENNGDDDIDDDNDNDGGPDNNDDVDARDDLPTWQ